MDRIVDEPSSEGRQKLDKLGLTKYVKAGDGMYEKRSGKGPDLISRDQAVKGSDFKHLD